jgi:3-phenylpropionate/trans-cinnamate dioxygenase ferredoxin reductase component
LDESIATSLKCKVMLGTEVKAINRSTKTVSTTAGDVAYTKLLIATGAKPRKLNSPGGEHALLLRNFEDAIALRERFQPGKNIVAAAMSRSLKHNRGFSCAVYPKKLPE